METNNSQVAQQWPPLHQPSLTSLTKDQFAVMQRVSMMFANSELVPEMYKIDMTRKEPRKIQPKKATANCMIAIEMAQRIGASPP